MINDGRTARAGGIMKELYRFMKEKAKGKGKKVKDGRHEGEGQDVRGEE
jgi:hypothetical protein